MMVDDIPLASIEDVLSDARRERRRNRIAQVGLAASVLLLMGAIVYVLTSYQVKTACETDPQGKECQRIKVESDKARSIRSACVITRLAGLGCPALDKRREREQNGSNNKSTGGDDDATTDPGNGPAPGPSAPDGPTPGGGGDGGGGSPDPPTGPDPPQAPDPPTATPTPPAPSAPPGADSPPTLGETIDGLTQPVCNATDQLGVHLAVCP